MLVLVLHEQGNELLELGDWLDRLFRGSNVSCD